MSPVVEQWFVTCLFVIGPQGERDWQAYLEEAQDFFRNYIPNGSGCGWYAHWYTTWVEALIKERADGNTTSSTTAARRPRTPEVCRDAAGIGIAEAHVRPDCQAQRRSDHAE